MTIELTTQQLQALHAGGKDLPRLIDPQTKATYVLVSEAEYEVVREILDDERRQQIIRETALRNAAGRMNESP